MITYIFKSDGLTQKAHIRITTKDEERVSGTCHAISTEKVSVIKKALEEQTVYYWTNYRSMCPDFAIN